MLIIKSIYFNLLAIQISIIKLIKKIYFATNFYNKSLISKIYAEKRIRERHRHRYEVNIKYKNDFEKKGLVFSALSPDGNLPEIIELKNHPWFIGVQFHPEFKSRPFKPHPLFASFIKAANLRRRIN